MRNYLLENNPSQGILSDMNWEWHQGGRAQFANSFARGGMVGSMFATTRGEALRGLLPRALGGTRTMEGSATHIKRLERIAQLHPDKAEKIGAQILKYKNSGMSPMIRSMRNIGMGLGIGAVVNAGFGLYAAYSVPGSLTDVNTWADRGVAGVAGIASGVGGGIGMKVGMTAGAIAGTLIMPGIGTAVGAVAGLIAGGIGGSMAAEGAVYGAYGVADRLVQQERDRRKFDWAGNRAMFQTEKAYTMRQMSLAAMNNGMASPRSLLGKEAIFVHR